MFSEDQKGQVFLSIYNDSINPLELVLLKTTYSAGLDRTGFRTFQKSFYIRIYSLCYLWAFQPFKKLPDSCKFIPWNLSVTPRIDGELANVYGLAWIRKNFLLLYP